MRILCARTSRIVEGGFDQTLDRIQDLHDVPALDCYRYLVRFTHRSFIPVLVRTWQDWVLSHLPVSISYRLHVPRLRLNSSDAPASSWPYLRRFHAESTFPAGDSVPVVCAASLQRYRDARWHSTREYVTGALHLRAVLYRAFVLDRS